MLALQAHGAQAQQVLAERRQQHDKSEDLRRALERRLRLRRLNKDPALSHNRSAFASRLFTQNVACDMLKKADYRERGRWAECYG